MLSKSDLPKSNSKKSVGTAVLLAVLRLHGFMHQAKRRSSVAKSDLNNEIKKSCAASKAAMRCREGRLQTNGILLFVVTNLRPHFFRRHALHLGLLYTCRSEEAAKHAIRIF